MATQYIEFSTKAAAFKFYWRRIRLGYTVFVPRLQANGLWLVVQLYTY